MKDTIKSLTVKTIPVSIFALLVASASIGNSQENFGSGKEPVDFGKGTVEPDDSVLFPGKRLVKYHRLTKVDIDGDMNYDGVIDNDDPADNGNHQTSPPGLQVGIGELSKMVVRFKAYNHDYDGELILRLEVAGINRADPTGSFSSLAEESESTGRIRVWNDAKKSVLILDSSDPTKRAKEWVGDREKIESGEPGGFPRTVYVEGVETSDKYDGDLRLAVIVLHKKPTKIEPHVDTVDHILVTVRPTAQPKDFVNNNAEGVWVAK